MPKEINLSSFQLTVSWIAGESCIIRSTKMAHYGLSFPLQRRLIHEKIIGSILYHFLGLVIYRTNEQCL